MVQKSVLLWALWNSISAGDIIVSYFNLFHTWPSVNMKRKICISVYFNTSWGHGNGDKHCTFPITSHAIGVMLLSSAGFIHFPLMNATQLPVSLPGTEKTAGGKWHPSHSHFFCSPFYSLSIFRFSAFSLVCGVVSSKVKFGLIFN